MKNFILFFALLMASLSATASNQYVCKCDAGSSAACAANVGSNTNSGTSASSPKRDLPTSVSGFSDNDTLFLCTGGSWVTSNGFVNSTNFGATTPFKINWYAPTTGCDVSCANTKPIISCTAADCTVINYGIGGAASNKNGFAMSNVELSCKGASGVTAGVGISGDSNYFTLNNFYIHDCGFGVISTGFLASQGSTDGNNDFLTFTNGT